MRALSRLRIPLLITVLGLVAAACGGSGGTAATVDGVVITDGDVDAMISESTVDTPTLRAQTLSTLIQWEIVSAAAEEDFGIVATEEDVDAELEVLLAEFGSPSVEDFVEQQQITQDLLLGYVEQTIIQRGIDAEFEAGVEDPTAQEIAAEREENVTYWTEVCASHILVEIEDEATEVFSRLDAGESFEDLAVELSTDTGSGANGGDLGCTAPYQYVEPFAEASLVAPVGEPYGPVETEFGFHILLVASRTDASDDDVVAFLREGAVIEVSDEWFITNVEAAVVEVDESYGTWVTDPEPSIIAVSVDE